MPKHIAEELAEQYPFSVCLVCKKKRANTVEDLHRQIGTHFDKCCGGYPLWLTSLQAEKYRLQEQEQSEPRNKKKSKTLDISNRAV